RERRRLRQLVELAYRHDARSTLRPVDFVRLAELERVEDPLRSRLRVMTVHQAKGLEFDAVVLPELDAPMFRQGRWTALPVRAGAVGRVVGVFPYLKREIRYLFPEVEEAYDEAVVAALRDGLSGFYVALTRARFATYAIVAEDGE